MTAPEQGFLLLTSYLGDPNRKPLTVAQFRTLAQRARHMEKPETEREMLPNDLISLGYDSAMAQHILALLAQKDQLQWYLEKARQKGCFPISRISPYYPDKLRKRLGLDAPGCLWAKGYLSLLDNPSVALVGSRELHPNNLLFAQETGRQAALQGYVLISGNARGADRQAQEACLDANGRVISVVADSLEKYPLRKNVLYLSEESFDFAFTAQRALSRNRIIHCLGELTLVAQSSFKKGGTWDGTLRNLQQQWSPVCCYDDSSAATLEFAQMGASLITRTQLSDIPALIPNDLTLFR